MQTICITLTIPDGVTFQVNSVPQPNASDFHPVAPVETKPAGPTLEDLKQAFLAAVKKNKDAAFKALGCAKCSEVPEGTFAAVIESLNAVV